MSLNVLAAEPGSNVAERQSNDSASPWWGEHVARYRLAASFVCRGTRALDVACGAGYGIEVLSAAGAEVVGADIDMAALRSARGQLPPKPDALIRADGRTLPFADGTFTLITSFETLEHLEGRSRFVAELRRVLAGDGVLLLSTPNANHTRPIVGRPRNPHHVHEYDPAELVRELRAHFPQVHLAGQVLDGRFRISPFWEDQQRMPRTAGSQALLWARRLVQRLPVRARDRVSRTLWGHAFFPTESDYHFDLARIEVAPVLLAICRAQESRDV